VWSLGSTLSKVAAVRTTSEVLGEIESRTGGSGWFYSCNSLVAVVMIITRYHYNNSELFIYYIHQICHLLSLDILCANAICLVYVNYATPSCLARHHICEFCNAILLSQSSYMWIISGHPFFCYVLHLSTMLVHATTPCVHQPFDTVMENSGVKTRSSD